MSGERTRHLGSQTVVLADDPTDLSGRDTGLIVVCGAPATIRNARALLKHAPSFVALHDAGVGIDASGIAGLERLEAFHVPAVAVGHDSARIGDADDVLDRGSVLHLNETARSAGLTPGPLAPQLDRFARAADADERSRPRRDGVSTRDPGPTG